MKEIITLIQNDSLLTALTLFPLAILVKNLLGAGHSLQSNNFNFNYLKRGLFKGILIYSAIGVLAFMATLSNELAVNVNGATLSLVQALTTIIYGSVIVYLKDIFTLLLEIFKQPTTVDENEGDDK